MKEEPNKLTSAVAYLIAAPVALVTLAPLYLWVLWSDAFVLSKLWAWFAVPIGLPALGIRAFVGANLIVATFRVQKASPKEPKETFWELMRNNLLTPWIVLGVGYLAQWWFA